MSEPAAPKGDEIPVVRWAIHTLLLFAAMVAPFFPFDIGTAPRVAVGAGFAYLSLWLAAGLLRNRGKPNPPAKIFLLHILYGISVPIAAGGLIWLLAAEWALWAYLPMTSPAETWDMFMNLLIALTAIFIYPPLLFLLLGPRLARKNGGPASRFLKGVRARGFGWFHINWLRNTAAMAGTICLLSMLWSPALLHLTARLRDSDGAVTNWELVATYPFLPFALLATAVMLALSMVLIREWETDEAAARAYIDRTAESPRPAPRTRAALGALVAGACGAALLIIIYPIHLGMTATVVGDAKTALGGVAEAWEILWNTHEDDDWTRAEVAEALNRFGHWTPDAPEAGLGMLVADPGQAFPESCTVRTAAGTIDRPARDPDNASPSSEDEADVKYCVAVACAPPFAWSAPPALLLFTSHASEAEGWREDLYVDVQANGRAAAPGGYCTADGALAESYQG